MSAALETPTNHLNTLDLKAPFPWFGGKSRVAHTVRDWAIANGSNGMLRIALCGYEGEHEMPPCWEKIEWKAHGGYGAGKCGRGDSNKHKERIWLSPHCLSANKQRSIFEI